MAKKIVILNGSPRLKGNTAQLISAFTKGAEESGNTVERFDLQKMNIHPCLGCCGGGKNRTVPVYKRTTWKKYIPPTRKRMWWCLPLPFTTGQ